MKQMQELNDDNYLETVKKESVVLIDFYASWCGSCRMAAPMFLKVAEEANIPIYKVEIEKNPKVKSFVNLPGLPSVALYKDGEPQDLINTTKEEQFREFLKKHGAKL